MVKNVFAEWSYSTCMMILYPFSIMSLIDGWNSVLSKNDNRREKGNIDNDLTKE